MFALWRFLYVRADRLAALFGGFRPDQCARAGQRPGGLLGTDVASVAMGGVSARVCVWPFVHTTDNIVNYNQKSKVPGVQTNTTRAAAACFTCF